MNSTTKACLTLLDDLKITLNFDVRSKIAPFTFTAYKIAGIAASKKQMRTRV